ncbi:hypothetical protein [Proteiniphilum sp.]
MPNFYTFFKKNTGINPSEFRNQRSFAIQS